MPKPRRDVVKDAAVNQLFVPTDLSSLEEDLGLPQIQKPIPGQNVDETFTNLDLPKISSRDLARYHQWVAGMLSFTLVQCAKADIRVNTVSDAIRRLTATLKVVVSDKPQKWQVEAEIDGDPRVQSLRKELEKAQATQLLLDAHREAYSARERMLSREVSRRSLDRAV